MLENYKVKEISCFPENGLTGRRKIKTTVPEITKDNIVEVLDRALAEHAVNAGEIQYLWDVYCGVQDIFDKIKYVRENINNKVVVNRANEIVTFKTAYLLNEPIQYISNSGEDYVSKRIIDLNEMMRSEDKESKDKEIVDWMHICGLAERFVITDEMAQIEDGAPYHIHTLDPREAFVIYSAGIGERPMAGVILQYDENDELFVNVYTAQSMFTVRRDQPVKEEPHILGGLPLIEYPNNMARMGAFETVIPILNAINQLESDAVDNIQDFVNGFDVFQNCSIDDEKYAELSIGGKAVRVKTVVPGMEAKVYRIASELSQSGVQSRIDDLTDAYLTICGMPNRNGGSSTSDTGQAVIFRDGWSEAESRAKDSEKLYTRSERQFLRIVLNICRKKSEGSFQLDLKDIGVNFARKSLNNLQSKFQCFTEGLGNGYIHPQDMYNAFGDIFGDKTAAYKRGMEWYNSQKQESEKAIQDQLNAERERIASNGGTRNTGTVSTGGSGDTGTESQDA